MNIFQKIWSWISNAFISFIKAAVNQLTQKFIVELKDFAIETVMNLATTDLTSEEKRTEAFNLIKAEAIERGLTFKDSAINLLIELAVTQLKKNEGEIV